MKHLPFLMVLCLTGLTLAQSHPVPLVNQPLVPESAKPGSGGFTLTVNGTEFISGATVQWNGSARNTQFISSSELKATINASDVAKAGTATISVKNPAPGGGNSNLVGFVIRNVSKRVPLAPDLRATLEPGPVAVADFNGDGKADIAIGWFDGPYKSGGVDVYLGNGDGTFAFKPIRTVVFMQSATVSVWFQIADFNADGKPDLGFNSFNGDGNDTAAGVVLLGNGDGTFTVTNNRYDLGSPAAADVNADGLVDLVTTGGAAAWDGECATDIYLGQSGGNYTKNSLFAQGCPNSNWSGTVALGDFNHDGKLDLAVGCSNTKLYPCGTGGQAILVALGNGDGTFQTPIAYQIPSPESVIIAADLNGDGNLDLVTDGVCTLLGKGDGTFEPATCSSPVTTNGTMVFGDFNGDGKLDAALLTPLAPPYQYGIDIYLGKGDGTFTAPLVYQAPFGSGAFLATGDFNGDGRTDLVVGSADNVTNAIVYLQTVANVSPTIEAFGNQKTGKRSSPQTVVFTNDETTTLLIEKIRILGKNADEFHQVNNCGSNLPAGSSCRIKLTFKPTSKGSATAQLVVKYKGTGGPQTVPLTGTGT